MAMEALAVAAKAWGKVQLGLGEPAPGALSSTAGVGDPLGMPSGSETMT